MGQRRRFGEAEPLFLETLEISKRVLGEEHPDTLSSMNSLVVLYQRWGKPEKAAEWRAKLAESQETE